MSKEYFSEVSKQEVLWDVPHFLRIYFEPFFSKSEFADLTLVSEESLVFAQVYCYHKRAPSVEHLEIVLRKQPFQLDHADFWGRTLLWNALRDNCGQKLYPFVPYLLSKGADVYQVDAEGDGIFSFLRNIEPRYRHLTSNERIAAIRNLRLLMMYTSLRRTEYNQNLEYIHQNIEFVKSALAEPLDDQMAVCKVIHHKKLAPASLLQYILERYL